MIARTVESILRAPPIALFPRQIYLSPVEPKTANSYLRIQQLAEDNTIDCRLLQTKPAPSSTPPNNISVDPSTTWPPSPALRVRFHALL